MKPKEYREIASRVTQIVLKSHTCPLCRGLKKTQLYTCYDCWISIPARSQHALLMADKLAPLRLLGMVECGFLKRPAAQVNISSRRCSRYGPYLASSQFEKLYRKSNLEQLLFSISSSGFGSAEIAKPW